MSFWKAVGLAGTDAGGTFSTDSKTGNVVKNYGTTVGDYGGAGSYGWVMDPSTNQPIGLSKEAYNAGMPGFKEAGMKFGTEGANEGLGGSEMLGLANLGLKGMGAFTDWQKMELAKDALDFNKMNANRNYDAERTKYNNAYDRTDAVNKVYGSQTVGTKI